MAKQRQSTAGNITKKTIRVPFAGNAQQRDTSTDADQRFINYVFETTKNVVTDTKKLFCVKRPGTVAYLDLNNIPPPEEEVPVDPCVTITITDTNTESSTVILVTFSEGVQIDSVTGWTFTKNGGPWVVSSVDSTEDPTQWEFTLGSAASAGDTLTIEYDGTGDMTDTDLEAACAIDETAIDNTLE